MFPITPRLFISHSLLLSGLGWLSSRVRAFSPVGCYPCSQTPSRSPFGLRHFATSQFPKKSTGVDDPSCPAMNVNEKHETWLVVGDGDLSYSAYMAQQLQNQVTEQNTVRLIASVLEDQQSHHKVYRNSINHTELLSSFALSEVRFNVDATQLSTYFGPNSLDRIIFNFPHWKGKTNIRYNRELINDFLHSASHVLKEETGEVHMALCQGQGGTEATNLREWRMSWMAAALAADHGFLLRRMEPFEPMYDLSSHRGVDRPFSVGKKPLVYVFGLPRTDKAAIDSSLRIAYRHELRILLDDNDIASSGITYDELVHGPAIPNLVQSVVPDGIVGEVVIRELVNTECANDVKSDSTGIMNDLDSQADFHLHNATVAPLMVFLVVYQGASRPLTRQQADTIRSNLEKATLEQLMLQVVKRNRMVSKPFPYPILNSLIN